MSMPAVSTLQTYAPATQLGGKPDPCNDGDCQPVQGETTPFVQGPGDSHAVSPDDIRQGQLNNCFLVAAMAAVAEQDPDFIRNMIRDNGDGTYTVTLHQYDEGGLFGIGSGWEEVEVTVSADFPQNSAQQSGDVENQRQEIWPQLIEKAYAQLNGGYAGFEDGGSPADALAVLTGNDPDSRAPSDYSFEDLSADFGDGNGDDAITFLAPEHFTGEAAQLARDHNVHPWHTYSVTRVYEENGVQMVELNNPWGSEDVTLPYADAQKIFSTISNVPVD
jgi:hypothetical protein